MGLQELEHNLCLVVMDAIHKLDRNFGWNKTIGFLRGSKSGFILRHDLGENEYYGALASVSAAAIDTVISYLLGMGYLLLEGVGRYSKPVIVVSDSGKDVLSGKVVQRLEAGIFSKKEVGLKNEQLYNELNELRYKLAKRDGKPSFCICINETIIAMANQRPKTKEELEKIKGVGKKFIENYADDFLLAIVEDHVEIVEAVPPSQAVGKGFECKCSVSIFNPEELRLIQETGELVEKLVSGDVRPGTEDLERLLSVCSGDEKPTTPLEKVWSKYYRRMAWEADPDNAKASTIEWADPGEDWYSRKAWKEERKRRYRAG